MYLTSLRLTDFRSYEAAQIPLSAGVTVFLGPNGHGKTNVVEAVQYLATLGSHRVATDFPLIRAGASSATVSVTVQAGLGDSRSLTVDVEIRTGVVNKARLNKAPARPREILGAVRTVFFAPEDLGLVQGDPAGRRQFLDELAISRWPRIAGVKSDYERVVKQKTALLKAMSGRSVRQAGAGSAETLDVWDDALADMGAELVAARLACVTDISQFVTEQYDAIAPVSSRALIEYSSASLSVSEDHDPTSLRVMLRERMAERRGEEIARGMCLVGPHRDDLALSLGELPVRGYASHGEGWSFALALRLACLDLLHEDGIEPILILDDVFAELDDVRRSRLVAAMDSVEQTLITTAVAGDLPRNLEATVYPVHMGRVGEPQQSGSQ